MKQFSVVPKQETAFTLLEIETSFTSIPMEGMFSDSFCFFDSYVLTFIFCKLSSSENKNSNLDKDEVGKMEGRVLTGNMTFYTGDMKNAFKLAVKYPILPKADIKSEKEVKAKKDTTIAALQRNQAVTWVKNGDGDVEFFNSQKELYPTHVPLYHVS